MVIGMSQAPIASTAPMSGPYVGPAALKSTDPIFGRDRDIAILLNALISERIVLLLSPSGAGKTSLIQAGLIPRLEAEQFKCVGVFRVGGSALLAGAEGGVYVGNVLQQWNASLPLKQRIPAKELANLSLKEFAKKVLPTDADQLPVIVFDQFEEVVTSELADAASVRNLFKQVGDLLSNPGLWALFAIREDYLGPIEEFLHYIPSGLRERRRLDFLTHDEAIEAITKPLSKYTDGNWKFDTAAAVTLAERLRMVRNARTLKFVPGNYVEPVLLQVVCASIWETISQPGKSSFKSGTISESEIPDECDIDRALGQFYDRAVGHVSERYNLLYEAKVRRWVDQELLDGLVRRQTRNGPTRTPEDANILQLLVDYYILRPTVRNDTAWYELSHDRLVEPVRDANLRWSRKYSPKERELKERAEHWSTSGSARDEYLLDTRELAEIDRAYGPDFSTLSFVEKQLVDASRAQLSGRRWKWILTAAAIVSMIAAGFVGIYAGHLEKRPETCEGKRNYSPGLLPLSAITLQLH